MAATANLKRYMQDEVLGGEWVSLVTIPAGYYFVSSGIYTTSQNTVNVRINGQYEIGESNEESNRTLRGFVFYPDDIIEVMHRNQQVKETIAICGELFATE